jgi:hypothetical protein
MKAIILEMNKKQWWILFLIALSTTVFRVILQAFIPIGGNNTNTPSAIAKAGLLPLAFTLFGIITFGLLAVIFVMIQDRLPGTKMVKGFLLGLSFSGLWIVYLLEPLPSSSNMSLVDLISYPIADGLTIVFLGLILGKFLGSDSTFQRKDILSQKIMSLVTIASFYIAARYIDYTVFKIYSSFPDKPLTTMLWTAITGIWIGIMYLLLSPGIEVKTPALKAIYFSFLVFGIDYTLFNLFIPIVFEASIVEFLVRSIMDIIPVCIGVYVFEKLRLGGVPDAN